MLTPQQQEETAQRIIHDAELLQEGAYITELGRLAITDQQWLRLHANMDSSPGTNNASHLPAESDARGLTRSDFHDAYSPARVWSGLFRLALNNPEFPLRPKGEDRHTLFGDVDAALAWIDEHRPTSRQAVFYDLLQAINVKRQRADTARSKN